MNRVLFVETNFLLEHAHAETEHAEVLLAAAESKKLALVVPAFCIFEAKRKERREAPSREQWARELDDLAKALGRKNTQPEKAEAFFTAAQHLRQLNDVRMEGLRETIARITACGRVLALRKQHIERAATFEASLSHGDPWLAAAIESFWNRLDPSRHDRVFLTTDRAVREVAEVVGIDAEGASAAVVKRWSLV